jgi:type IV fimbrial biogenesis protein FimT
MDSHRGFTLVELLVTVSLGAILIAMATPGFVETSVRNRLVAHTNDLISSVNFARSESIRRGVPVVICPSADGASCSETWSDGWLIFVNTNGGSPAVVDEGETVLRVHEGLSDRYTLNASASFADNVTFGADGAARTVGTFAFCHSGRTAGARAIVVTMLRPYVARDTDGDRVPNVDGENLESCTEL